MGYKLNVTWVVYSYIGSIIKIFKFISRYNIRWIDLGINAYYYYTNLMHRTTFENIFLIAGLRFLQV